METILKTNSLTKKYGRKAVVNEVNMTIHRGEIYGFIGENGAGKTTLMRLVLGTAFPTDGSVELFGGMELSEARKKIGSLIEAPGIYKNCTALENMKRFAILCGETEEKCVELLQFVGLGDVGKKKSGRFSLGMRQRLGIAIALLGDPEFLVLDEPVNGLDPSGIKEVRDVILKLNRERNITVLISSHLLEELSKIVTRYGIIHQGVLMEEVSAEELESRCSTGLQIRVDDVEKAQKILLDFDPELKISVANDLISIRKYMDKSGELNKMLVQNDVLVKELTFKSFGLEDYFVERIGGANE